MLETWREITTNLALDPDTDFATPSLVMQTAASTLSTNQSLDIYWTTEDRSVEFVVILHIGEIVDMASTDHREFNIFADGDLLFSSIVLKKLDSWWASYVCKGRKEYNVSLKATTNSNLPPLLNALEIYVNRPVTGVPTSNGDGKV